MISFIIFFNILLNCHTNAYHSNLRLDIRDMSLGSTISKLTSTIKENQLNVNLDEKSKLMLDALRGKNLNDDDKQGLGVEMKIVEFNSNSEDSLPTVYDPLKLENYFNKRPTAVFTRIWQIVSVSSLFFIGLLFDLAVGNTEDIEVRRAAELRNTIISLGPFFIKLGQALSIRPDILSPRSMVELQKLCDKVPSFDSKLAMKTIENELGRPPSEIFSKITPEPVAAASLGQVYKATLASTNEEVAVKVQRPFVLETVSLDLYLVRQLGLILRNFPEFSNRLDIVALLDEFAGNFYQELDYNLECANGIRIAEDMKRLPKVVIPKNYPDYTSRRVHVAEWINGEKLSQSIENDVGSLVNLGVITYLTQLLDTGFFHADPHPGNMLRTPDGRLVILDFGLMTQITDDQKYGMVEAIAHLIHRDYDAIGNDFINLDFIPRGTDTTPIIPALTRVFEAALAGGGAKSLNFQELAADLAEITFRFPFRIPPYFALIIRAISVLEGVALVGNPEFALVDEAYPYISKRLMTDDSPRLRETFRYMLYGKSNVLDIDRMIDMLQALEKFVSVKEYGDGTSYKVDGMRGNRYVGKAGDSKGTKTLETLPSDPIQHETFDTDQSMNPRNDNAIREALKFFFSNDGQLLRGFILDELTTTIDALSREAIREIVLQLGIPTRNIPILFKAMAPKLTPREVQVVDSIVRLIQFLMGNEVNLSTSTDDPATSSMDHFGSPSRTSLLSSFTSQFFPSLTTAALEPWKVIETARQSQSLLLQYLPLLQELSPNMQDFANQIIKRLYEKSTARFIKISSDSIFGVST